MLKRILCVLLIQCFVLSNVSFAITDVPKERESKIESSALAVDSLVIPRDFGVIKERSNGANGKMILYIQDAHCNYEAQTNIANILDYLIKNYDVNFVAVEGADGIVDTSWFRAFPDNDIKREVADYFMKKGEITGAEFLSITSDYPFTIYGAEDRKHYVENLNSFLESYPYKEEFVKYYTSVKLALDKLKKYIYTKELTALDSKVTEHKEKRIKFADYIKYLEDMANTYHIDIKGQDNFSVLLEALKHEKDIDFDAVNDERAVLIDELSNKLSKEELSELVNKSLSFKLSKIDGNTFYSYLAQLSKTNDISISQKYGNLAKYMVYTKIYSKINNEILFEEIDVVVAGIKEKLFTNDDQRTLDKLWRDVNVILGFINIELTNKEYEYYLDNRDEFTPSNFVSFISSQTSRYGLSYDVAIPDEHLNKVFNRLIDFYEIALKRDKILVENMFKGMHGKKTDVAVLITGGFHTKGITKFLHENEASYVVISPSITKEEKSPYIEVLTGQKTPFEELIISSEKSQLAPPSRLNRICEGLGIDRFETEKSPWATSFRTDFSNYLMRSYIATFTDTPADKLKQQLLDNLKTIWANIADRSRNKLFYKFLVSEINEKFDSIYTQAHTPGGNAVGQTLNITQAALFDKILTESFVSRNAHTVTFNDVRFGFNFVLHDNLIEELDKNGLPVNIHPGRGGDVNKHRLLQAHLDTYVFNQLTYEERMQVARHELAHLDIFNLEQMSENDRKALSGTDAYKTWKAWVGAGKPTGEVQEDFVNSLPDCDTRPIAEKINRIIEEKRGTITQRKEPTENKKENLRELRGVVSGSEGVEDVLAITNGGDGKIVEDTLNGMKSHIFRRDGKTRVMAHEEQVRRGQLLGLLDAMRKYGKIDPNGVSLGIMMPGKGTRFSPFTQRLFGIKPFMPMLIRADKNSPWLSGAAASLYTWNLVAYHLKRMGFKGIAWKWGDEPQVSATQLSDVNMDLTNADIVRFGSRVLVTQDLAENKEWLNADANGNLIGWARRRSREDLLVKLGIKDTPEARAMVHIGSPAFSYLFIEKAEEVFTGVSPNVWLDVDGYLIEALTLDRAGWEAEKERDSGIAKVLEQCPDFYERCQKLRAEIEAARGGRPLEIKVVDFDEELYWGDIGQLKKARESLYQLAENTPEGEFARELAYINDAKRDKFGNIIVGSCVYPQNGTVRNSILIDTKIYGKANIEGAVLVNSNLGNARIGKGSVVFGSTVVELRMDENAFSFYSVSEKLTIRADWVHTTMPKNMEDIEKGLDNWWAFMGKNKEAVHMEGNEALHAWLASKDREAREKWLEKAVDVGSAEYYREPRFGNPRSFEEQQEIMRQRNIPFAEVEEAMNNGPVRSLIEKMSGKIERAVYNKQLFSGLSFGTSGLRDTVENMTDMESYINTRGFIEYLIEIGDIKRGDEIPLAGDYRYSTDRIARAIGRAIIDSGCKVDYCGKLPSPAVAYYAMQTNKASIMVTGSHIPDDRNGIKFTKKSGEILKSDEEGILRNVARAREAEYAKTWQETIFKIDGSFKKEASRENEKLTSIVNENARELYIARYVDTFPKGALAGIKIVLYQHSAVGRDIMEEILLALGATVIPIGRSEKFIPVDTEKVSEETKAIFKKAARDHKPDVILTMDGDSDRPLLADEKGNFLPGDKLGVLVSLYLNPTFVAIPISANTAVISALEEKGIKVVSTQIGSPYVIKAMNAELSENPAAKVASWEVNGGFLTGSDWEINGNVLKALPTRDAVLSLLASILLAKNAGKSLSEAFDQFLPHRYTQANVIDNETKGCEIYTADMGKALVKSLTPKEKGIVEVRFSTNEVLRENGNVEGIAAGAIAKAMNALKERLEGYFTPERGFGKIDKINYIDGVKIYFNNGDIAHLRPSGNAPEFRVYSEASTQARADSIIAMRGEILPAIIRDFNEAFAKEKALEVIASQERKPTPGVYSVQGTAGHLRELIAVGTKYSLDSVEPELIDREIQKGATSATSNPIIISGIVSKVLQNIKKHGRPTNAFEKIIYDILMTAENEEHATKEITKAIVKDAAAKFVAVYESTAKNDGYVSIEVEPRIEDKQAGPYRAMSFNERVEEVIKQAVEFSQIAPNILIKVPATEVGLAALEELAYRGINLNVTLVFTPRQAKIAREAIYKGLMRRKAEGKPLDVKSVYSIFVSRTDAYTAKNAPELGIANGEVGTYIAKKIYEENRSFWQDKGLPLKHEMIFASTGNKDEALAGIKTEKDVDRLARAAQRGDQNAKDLLIAMGKYVYALAGDDIQTNPPLTAYAVDIAPKPITEKQVDKIPLPQARRFLVETYLQKHIEELERELMKEGVEKFVKPQVTLVNDIKAVMYPSVEKTEAVIEAVYRGEVVRAVESFFAGYQEIEYRRALSIVSNEFIKERPALSELTRKRKEAVSSFVEEFYKGIIGKAVGVENVDVAIGLQRISAHAINVLSWIDRRVRGAEKIRLTDIRKDMVKSTDKERGPSYLDFKTIAVGITTEEGNPSFYWRGAEGTEKLGKSLLPNNAYADNKEETSRLVMYLMDHGFVEVPEELKEMTRQGSMSALHETIFINRRIPKSVQYVSTGKGHWQGYNLDVKQVTKGAVLQMLDIYDKEGRKIKVLAHIAEEGEFTLAIPGAVDYMIPLTEIVQFNDISVTIGREMLEGINPFVKTAEMAQIESAVKKSEQPGYAAVDVAGKPLLVKVDQSAPQVEWIKYHFPAEISRIKNLVDYYAGAKEADIMDILEFQVYARSASVEVLGKQPIQIAEPEKASELPRFIESLKRLNEIIEKGKAVSFAPAFNTGEMGYKWGQPVPASFILELKGAKTPEEKIELAKKYKISAEDKIAEWVIAGGFIDVGTGYPLPVEVLSLWANQVFGAEHVAQFGAESGITKKVLASEQNLSLQSHAFSEMIVPLDRGKAFIGLKKDVTAEELMRASAEGTVQELLNVVELYPNQPLLVPAYTPHAYGKVKVYEVKATTPKEDKEGTISFFDRLKYLGERPLQMTAEELKKINPGREKKDVLTMAPQQLSEVAHHLAEAEKRGSLKKTDLTKLAFTPTLASAKETAGKAKFEILGATDRFITGRYTLNLPESTEIEADKLMQGREHSLLVTEGEVELRNERGEEVDKIKAGEELSIPASVGKYTLIIKEGPAVVYTQYKPTGAESVIVNTNLRVLGQFAGRLEGKKIDFIYPQEAFKDNEKKELEDFIREMYGVDAEIILFSASTGLSDINKKSFRDDALKVLAATQKNYRDADLGDEFQRTLLEDAVKLPALPNVESLKKNDKFFNLEIMAAGAALAIVEVHEGKVDIMDLETLQLIFSQLTRTELTPEDIFCLMRFNDVRGANLLPEGRNTLAAVIRFIQGLLMSMPTKPVDVEQELHRRREIIRSL